MGEYEEIQKARHEHVAKSDGRTPEEEVAFVERWKRFIASLPQETEILNPLFDYLVAGDKLEEHNHNARIFDIKKIEQHRQVLDMLRENIFSKPSYAGILCRYADIIFPGFSERKKDITLRREKKFIKKMAELIAVATEKAVGVRVQLYAFLILGKNPDGGVARISGTNLDAERSAAEWAKEHIYAFPEYRGRFAGRTRELFPEKYDTDDFGMGQIKNIKNLEKDRRDFTLEEIFSFEANEKNAQQRVQDNADRRNREYRDFFVKQHLPRLWPAKDGGLNNRMRQGQYGDCYLVSVVDAIKHADRAEGLLARTMHARGNREWGIWLFDEHKYNSDIPRSGWTEVIVNEKEVVQKHEGLREGSLGDRLLERAYARFEHGRRGGAEGRTMMLEYDREDEYGRKHKDALFGGGHPYRTAYAFLGPRYEKFRTYATYGAGGKPVSVDFLPALSRVERDKNDGFFFIGTKKQKDIDGKGGGFFGAKTPEWFVPQHAYVISAVDVKNRQVLLRNPHDTSKSYRVSFGELQEYAMEIYGVVKKKLADENKKTPYRVGITQAF